MFYHDNCIFCFKKLLKSNIIKIQNDVLTRDEYVKGYKKFINYWRNYQLRFNYIWLYLSRYNIKKCWECSNGSKHNVE